MSQNERWPLSGRDEDGFEATDGESIAGTVMQLMDEVRERLHRCSGQPEPFAFGEDRQIGLGASGEIAPSVTSRGIGSTGKGCKTDFRSEAVALDRHPPGGPRRPRR
jgi:hypothetical protein